MMQGKSDLNPHATPYIPLPKNLSGMSFGEDDEASKKTVEIAGNSEDVGIAGHCRLPDSTSMQYAQCIKPVHVPNELSSKMYHSLSLDEETDILDDLDSLSTIFPNYSKDCLDKLLNANHGDFDKTVADLEQLEDDDEDFSELFHDSSVPASQKSNSAGPSSSTSSPHFGDEAHF